MVEGTVHELGVFTYGWANVEGARSNASAGPHMDHTSQRQFSEQPAARHVGLGVSQGSLALVKSRRACHPAAWEAY